MQLTALGKEDRMGFFQMLSRPSGDRAFLSGAFLFLSLLILPFSGDRPFALLFLVAGLSFLWVAFGRFQSLIGLLLPLFLLYGVGGGVTLPTAYLSLLLGGACGVELLFYFAGRSTGSCCCCFPPRLSARPCCSGEIWARGS